MRAPYRLPRAVTPFGDESLPGLVMRDALPYRFRQPMRLFRRLRPPKVTLWTFCQQEPDTPMATAVANLLGLDGAALGRMTMWTGGETSLAVLGHPVWADLVRHSARTVCPACLREGAYHRAAWLLNAVPFCPGHAVRLLDRCGGCGRPVAWTGSDVCRCGNRNCRADLRAMPAEPVEPARLASATALLDLFHGRREAPLGLPPGEALRLSFLVGKLALGYGRMARPPGFVAREADRLPEILAAGWDALDDWPHGFRRLLDRMRRGAAERKAGAGVVRTFGKLSLLVWEAARQPWGGPVGVAFAEYAASVPELRTSASALRGYAPGADLRQEYMSVSEAQKFLGISPAPMMEIAKRRNLFVLAPAGSGPSAPLKAEAIRRLREEMRDLILPEEARAILGVGMETMARFEEAGAVRRVPLAERVMEFRPFRRSEVEAFVAACLGGAPLVSAGECRRRGLTPLASAAKGNTTAEICRALADGRLRAAARMEGRRGLSQICLRMGDVHRVLPVGRSTMSVVEAAGVLETRYSFLHGWIRQGLLEAVTSDSPNERGARITADGLARFRRDYVLGNELAQVVGQPGSNWLSRHLLFQGVRPVSGRAVDGCDVLLFRRADCTPEVMDAVRRTQAGTAGTPAEKRKAALAQGERAASVVAARWGAVLEREHNLHLDRAGGRALQVVAGRRPDMTGVFRFTVHQPSMARLTGEADPWVALVPNQADVFLLMPSREVGWTFNPKGDATVSVQCDVRGRPLRFQEWVVGFPEPSDAGNCVPVPPG